MIHDARTSRRLHPQMNAINVFCVIIFHLSWTYGRVWLRDLLRHLVASEVHNDNDCDCDNELFIFPSDNESEWDHIW